MRFTPADQEDDFVRFDLTPLVDVVFLLIIFFMVTTTFVYQPSITINLPGSSQPVNVNRNYISISIDRSGGIFLFEKRVESTDELFSSLRREFERDPERVVLIRGDKDSKYENIVKVIDTVKRTGLKRVLIATKTEYAR
ncbi:biopolymer transporter ExbD [bacterium]|nr:biopolymer transporter ExbD [bacterium]